MYVEELLQGCPSFFVPCKKSIVSRTSAYICTRSGSSLGTGFAIGAVGVALPAPEPALQQAAIPRAVGRPLDGGRLRDR